MEKIRGGDRKREGQAEEKWQGLGEVPDNSADILRTIQK